MCHCFSGKKTFFLYEIIYQITIKKYFKDVRKFEIRIKKNIPQEAGLGGGSMNAATLLNYFIKKKFIRG